METNYEKNLEKYKTPKEQEQDKKIQRVVSGTAKTKKKSELHKFTEIFVSEDINSVKNYIFIDVLVPAVKTALSDIVTNGIEMLLYGETGRSKRKSSDSKTYRSYDRVYDDRRRDRTVGRTRSGYSYEEVIVNTRGEAEEVLDQLGDVIEQYGMASVADLYEMVGITGMYTDNKYGWTDIRNASVARIREGYLLKLPRPLPFD